MNGALPNPNSVLSNDLYIGVYKQAEFCVT